VVCFGERWVEVVRAVVRLAGRGVFCWLDVNNDTPYPDRYLFWTGRPDWVRCTDRGAAGPSDLEIEPANSCTESRSTVREPTPSKLTLSYLSCG
jgi:hypothetical protein